MPEANKRAGSGLRPARRLTLRKSGAQLIRAISSSDEAAVDQLILRLAGRRRWLAPLALTVGGFAMLLDGLKLLLTNWRLTLIQVLPAMWIWAAMYDIKLHVLRGKEFRIYYGPPVVVAVLVVVVITAASFYLNAAFAYAITGPRPPRIRPAFATARSHLAVVLGSGAVVGLLLGVAALVVTRWGLFWYALSMRIVVGIMMICYVAVPSRLVGVKSTGSGRDRLTASAVAGLVGGIVCTPPYALGRLGLLMLGTHALFIPGIIVFAIGFTLQAGATGAVKTVKMSVKLMSGHQATDQPLSGQALPQADRAAAPDEAEVAGEPRSAG